MNDMMQAFARENLTSGLLLLPEAKQRVFKLMYGRAGGTRTVADAEAMPINEVVAEIPADKLDWAMQQVQRSIDKLVV